MRGGVSLAVWIGGAVAELDVLRPTTPGPEGTATLRRGKSPERPAQQQRAEIYANMLRLARYDEVKIDVLAGASAGGLNAVVYGVAQCVGSTVDAVRNLWLDDADLWQMMRSPARSVGCRRCWPATSISTTASAGRSTGCVTGVTPHSPPTT
ncbi:hypothetical protein [Micromonospora sp. LOL_021]|uniref:hypothetical protein n=1 Tax=Micromonospora sp. LOL_021 TaxID=3345417 RepID=UPI003A85A4E2